jgi:F420-0:gamma-glutamyl ligase
MTSATREPKRAVSVRIWLPTVNPSHATAIAEKENHHLEVIRAMKSENNIADRPVIRTTKTGNNIADRQILVIASLVVPILDKLIRAIQTLATTNRAITITNLVITNRAIIAHPIVTIILLPTNPKNIAVLDQANV